MSQPGDEPTDGPEESRDDAASPPPSAVDEHDTGSVAEPTATEGESPPSASLSRVFDGSAGSRPNWMSASTRRALNDALAVQMPDFAGLVTAPLRDTLNQIITAQMPNFAELATAPLRETLNQIITAQMPNFAELATAPLRDTLNQIVTAQMPNFAELAMAPLRETLNQVIAAQVPDLAALVAPSMREPINQMFVAQQAQLTQLALGPNPAVSQMWAGQAASFTKLASVPPTALVNRALADQFDAIVGHLDEPMAGSSETLADLVADVSEALSSGTAEAEAGAPTEAQLGDEVVEGTGDEFASTLDALIAVGLVGKDLLVNTTVTAWLVTVRQVDRVKGRKAARRALATFVTVALTCAWAAWLVNDGGDKASQAFATAAQVTLPALLAVWWQLGGE